MNKLIYSFLFCFASVLFLSCVDNRRTIIKALIEKYPERFGSNADELKLIRSVTIGEKDIQLNLYSQNHVFGSSSESIITISNVHGNTVALPFFSNTYRDYWDFPFEKPQASKIVELPSFEEEFRKALETLQLNDTLGTSAVVIETLFVSLLQCQILDEFDTAEMTYVYGDWNKKLKAENYDSCRIRLNLNYKTIRENISVVPYLKYFDPVYFDRVNFRIYQFHFESDIQSKELVKFDLDVFRQDCVFREMYWE